MKSEKEIKKKVERGGEKPKIFIIKREKHNTNTFIYFGTVFMYFDSIFIRTFFTIGIFIFYMLICRGTSVYFRHILLTKFKNVKKV